MGYIYALVLCSCIIAFCMRYAIDNFTQHRVCSHRATRQDFVNDQKKTNTAIGQSHRCRPPPRLVNQRPLGVDRLEQIVRADRESRLMPLFLSHFRLWGTTLDHVFLGIRAVATIEPRNLEAILSTYSQGCIPIRSF